jgi:ribonucleoside-diphosphate reductase beta chain
MIAGYDHFVTLADSLQWDEKELDLTADAEAWPRIGGEQRAQVLGLLAGFCIGENAVATELGSFQHAAGEDASMVAAFRAQERDEQRHARFFDRVVTEVAGVPGSDLERRLDFLRGRVSPELVELFEQRLPRIARQLAEDRAGLVSAVGLYHMILEGVVLLAAQHALLDVLAQPSVPLPGTHHGMELVLRDERWHIGFGSRVVQSAEAVGDEMEELLREGEKASAAWGELIPPGAVDKAAQLHRRRLKAVNIKFW